MNEKEPQVCWQYSLKNSGLKPKGERKRSFLVLHPSSGEDTVNTVGSRLKRLYFKIGTVKFFRNIKF